LKASIAAGHSKGPASYLGFPGGIVGLHEILKQDRERIESTNPEAPHSTFWNDKLVVVGSMANGNNMGDTGATPLAPTDALVSTYPNVANSILHNRFVHRMPFGAELSLVALWTALAAFATWKLRPVYSVSALVVANLILAAFGLHVFVGSRLWLPLAHPITGAIFLGFSPMITYRVLFSQREQQRVTAFFAKLVSPNVVQELLKLDRLALGGARREMTVFFADVRGFTEMTDRFQADAEEHVRLHGLEGAAAEAHFETKAGEVLETVNQYLAAIADVIKSNGGTLDKYIGDCVMAFWGAPTLNPRHAVDSVVAAIEAQRSIARLNDRRAGENAQIENENKARTARGDRPIPLLPLLALGSGLNTGVVTVGTMGSDQHGLNYTVFGREVNLASRLEGVSGRSRIVIGEATFTALRSLAPDLAKICVPLEPVSVKGFRQPIQAYEVLWRDAGDGTIRTRQVDSR
jgi:adenylate cyclase